MQGNQPVDFDLTDLTATEEAMTYDVSFRGETVGQVELADASGFRLQGRWQPGSAESLLELERAIATDGEAWVTVEFLGRVRVTSMPGEFLRAELAAACQAGSQQQRQG